MKKFLVLTTAALLTSMVVWAAPTQFSQVTPNTTSPEQYKKFEVTFELSTAYSNPFDPTQADVQATITTPSGTQETISGFFKQKTSPKWAVRYSPRQTGPHSMVIRVTDANGTGFSQTINFSALSASNPKGFLKTSGDRFINSDGTAFVLRGANAALYDMNAMQEILNSFATAKMNFVRMWISHYTLNTRLENKAETVTQRGVPMTYEGLNRYQLDNAARIDQIFQWAEAAKVRIQLNILAHADLVPEGADYWPKNAYNTVNGGPCNAPAEFFTNATAKTMFARYVRYIAARWGYSTALGVLEFGNELDNKLTVSNTDRIAWHQTMANAWNQFDPYGHPKTTSFAFSDKPWRNDWNNKNFYQGYPMLNAVNEHVYTRNRDVALGETYTLPDTSKRGLGAEMAAFRAAVNKPSYIGEYGLCGEDQPYPTVTCVDDLDKQTKTFDVRNYHHDGVFAPYFHGGGAGTALHWRMAWWWVPPQEIRVSHTLLADIVEPEAAYLPSMNHVAYGDQGGFYVSGFRSNARAIFWINNSTANWFIAYNTDYSQPPSLSGKTFTLTGMSAGNYTARYWNTYTGALVRTDNLTASGGSLVLNIPAFRRDIVVKVTPEGTGAGQPPSIQLTSPKNGAVFTAPASTTIVATASDPDGTVVKVQFFGDGVLLGEKLAPPFEFAWSNIPTGPRVITAQATDNSGLTANSASVTIQVGPTTNQLPTIQITKPLSGTSFTSPASINIEAVADDADGAIAKVEFFRGSATGVTKLGEDLTAPYAFAWTNVAQGDYNLTARATDNQGGVGLSLPVAASVQAPPPPPDCLGSPFASPKRISDVLDLDQNGQESVTLDGSKSCSNNTTIVSYTWSRGGANIATGVNPTVTLPLGYHSITLTVTDNQGGTHSTLFTVAVVGKKTASATNASAGSHALVNDQQISTRWVVGGTMSDAWITLDLGAAKNTSLLRYYCNGTGNASDTSIEYSSDNAEWWHFTVGDLGQFTEHVNTGAAFGWNVLDFNDPNLHGRSVRYIRFLIRNPTPGSWAQMGNYGEIEVYGVPDTTTDRTPPSAPRGLKLR